MRILALDLATSTGFAYNNARGEFLCGSWLLATDKQLKVASKQRMNRRLDMRVLKLFENVKNLHGEQEFGVVVFEDVQFQSYTLWCQLWASLRAAMWLAPTAHKQPVFEAVPVKTLKKFATGHGGATKAMMVKALVKSDNRFFAVDDPEKAFYNTQMINDDAVDAVWLHKWAQQNLGRLK